MCCPHAMPCAAAPQPTTDLYCCRDLQLLARFLHDDDIRMLACCDLKARSGSTLTGRHAMSDHPALTELLRYSSPLCNRLSRPDIMGVNADSLCFGWGISSIPQGYEKQMQITHPIMFEAHPAVSNLPSARLRRGKCEFGATDNF